MPIKSLKCILVRKVNIWSFRECSITCKILMEGNGLGLPGRVQSEGPTSGTSVFPFLHPPQPLFYQVSDKSGGWSVPPIIAGNKENRRWLILDSRDLPLLDPLYELVNFIRYIGHIGSHHHTGKTDQLSESTLLWNSGLRVLVGHVVSCWSRNFVFVFD